MPIHTLKNFICKNHLTYFLKKHIIENMKKINKNMTIEQVLKIDSKLADVLTGFGMHCIYCPMSLMETLEEAATVHEIDCDFLVEKLNQTLKDKSTK